MLASIDDLLNVGRGKEQKKKFKVYVKELDRELECNLLSRKEYLDIVLDTDRDTDAEVIYNSCAVFRDDKLIKGLKCDMAPVEVVGKILSFSTIYSLAKVILEKSDIQATESVSKFISVVDDDIKN